MTVILSQPKQYNDVATETFGPLEKYAPANDNFKGAKSWASGGVVGPVGEVPQIINRDYVVPRAVYERMAANAPKPTNVSVTVSVPVAQQSARHGDWMQTYSGRQFWPMDPRSDEVFIEDIAHSLSLQCRYAGHCERFYSVAEHSVHLARHLRWQGVEVALWALLHDASEAYLVDVPRPVKGHLVGYKDAEAKVMAAVCERFGLSPTMPAVVHEADNRIIGDELVNMTPMDWHERYSDPLGVSIRCWYPAQAEEEFLATFEALMDCRARGME